MERKTILFNDLGTAPKVSIPSNYEGFSWAAYTLDGVFEGTVYVTTSEYVPHSIYSVGFEMKLVNENDAFSLNSVVFEAASSNPDPVEVEVIGYLGGKKMYSQAVALEKSSSRIDFPSNTLDRVQFKSIMMDTFRVFEIDINLSAESPPSPPSHPTLV